MLLPAGVLVMLTLAAMAIDLSLVFLRQRQASAAAADIANDLATAALDVDELRASGTYRLDPVRADQLGRQLAEAGSTGDDLVDVEVEVLDDSAVRVVLTLAVDYLFAKAIPGAADGTEVHAAATARAVAGGEPAP